jgi:phenylacetic acid degradation operon negative regulatory protein
VSQVEEEGGADRAGHARGAQPRALIATIYGLYAREAGGWLSISVLIRLMAALGADETAVRSSISRLKRRSILVPEKRDGAAGYALSDLARTLLTEGERRIFGRHSGGSQDGWLMAIFSVPEFEREKRHQLRSRLSWLGFGTVASGVWIAPAQVESEAKDALEARGLSEYVDLFRAEYVGVRPQREQIAEWWDLEGLERMYEDFIVEFGPVLARWRLRRHDDDETAFADFVTVLTHWRRLPHMDPGLPADLLPPDWRGSHAAAAFFELRDRLAPSAHRHVQRVARTQPGSSGDTA